jgi:predicted DNA-binding transcriptional regulator AlpA
MTNTKELQYMTNGEVSALQKITATTTRSRIHRSKNGKSAPDFPAPIRKFGNNWAWDRLEVEQWLARTEMS